MVKVSGVGSVKEDADEDILVVKLVVKPTPPPAKQGGIVSRWGRGQEQKRDSEGRAVSAMTTVPSPRQQHPCLCTPLFRLCGTPV